MFDPRRLAALAGFFLSCLTATALAQVSASSVFIEQLTTQEVSAALKAGKTTVIIPIGGTEQNGPHMAIGKHNTRASALAGQIAAALGTALVAPVVAYTPEGNIDPPTEHMGFAGTISIPDDVFKGVLLGAARSFKKHGFTDIVLLGDSGNYQKLLAAAGLMAFGIWLHLTEHHDHLHQHVLLEHDHEHDHPSLDVHHAHGHTPAFAGRHTHVHQHEALNHTHAHYPDAHHRHGH